MGYSVRKTMLKCLLVLAVLYTLMCLLIYLQQERFLFFPQTLSADHQFNFPWLFEEIYLPADDGATLHVLHARHEQPRGVVVYFHGNGGSLHSWGSVATDWMQHGYDVIMPDYRGYGKSTGSLRNQAMLLADAHLVYAYALEQVPAEQIVLVGRSLGSGIATALASEITPRLLILETPYVSISAMARRQFPLIPARLLKYPLRTDQWLPLVACPIYLIHGSADELIPFSSSTQLAQLVPERTTLIEIAGGGHNNLTMFSAYQQALAEILD